jgi:hypothetical protein
MMITRQLASQVRERGQQANGDVAAQCIENPALLRDIAEGLAHNNSNLAGDCAEVFTNMAGQRPDLVAPYADTLAAYLQHKKTRVRWEPMHALALTASLVPATIQAHWLHLSEIIRTDTSLIVRDYAVDAIGNYAAVGIDEAQAAYPLLKAALSLWEGKHAGHASNGLSHVARQVPSLRDELRGLGQEYLGHGRAVIQKAAKSLIKTIEKQG